MMEIACEQIFYGRGAKGYGILGASLGAAKVAANVESLCRAIGTPGSDYGGEAFLLSVPEDGGVIMICGRRGAPDSMGRATLFLHALIAAKKEFSAAKMDAFSLFASGAFADKMPDGEIGALNIDVKTNRSSAAPARLDVSLPCVFRSEKPLKDLVCAAVGGRTNDLSWATFTFQPLPGFDVQVLPPRVQGLQVANEYDASGRLMRSAAVVHAPLAEEKLGCDRGRGMLSHYSNVSHESSSEKSNAMLKFSIVANLVLVAVCAVLLVSSKSMSDSPSSKTEQIVVTNFVEKVVEKLVETPISVEQKAAIKCEELNRMKREFAGRNKITHFEVDLAMFPKIDLRANRAVVDEKLADAEKIQDIVDRLRVYVDFVNTEILEEKSP